MEKTSPKHENLTTMNVLQYFYSPYWVDPAKPFLCCLSPAIFAQIFKYFVLLCFFWPFF